MTGFDLTNPIPSSLPWDGSPRRGPDDYETRRPSRGGWLLVDCGAWWYAVSERDANVRRRLCRTACGQQAGLAALDALAAEGAEP